VKAGPGIRLAAREAVATTLTNAIPWSGSWDELLRKGGCRRAWRRSARSSGLSCRGSPRTPI
jgi:hypothetical protein